MNADTTVLLDIQNASKQYDGKTVLNNVSVKVSKGDVIAVIGPSGSGKSTFLRLLNGLETLSSGRIFFENADLTDKKTDINAVRQKIGMVFQQFNLFNHLTVLQNITLAPVKLKRVPVKEAERQARDLLEKVGLPDKADAYPAMLSGGQKQRIAIARALAMSPDIMLFDEPTSALDPQMVGEVLELVRKLAHKGMTMLLVTHEMGFAREIANRVLFFDEHKIIADAAPADIFDNPQMPRIRDFVSKILK